MGQDFIYGLLTSMDGEKDPRNLVLMFSIYPIVVQNIDMGPFTEEMFEVVAAYFPIDFVPVSLWNLWIFHHILQVITRRDYMNCVY